MKASENLLHLLGIWEGKCNHVYPDSGGAPTIGIGHLLTKSERKSGKVLINSNPVRYRDGLTDEQVYALLGSDIQGTESAVDFLVLVPVTQNQFDALVSFVFNIGIHAFSRSTLLKKLNAKEYDAIPDQFRRWVWDNGRKVTGLANRREKEIALWLQKTQD